MNGATRPEVLWDPTHREAGRRLSRGEQAVFDALARLGGRDLRPITATNDAIAATLGLHPGTVRRHLPAIERAGLIRRDYAERPIPVRTIHFLFRWADLTPGERGPV